MNPEVQSPDVRRVGILIDGYLGLAGAFDLLVSVIDSMCRAANDREIILLLRQPPGKWSPRWMVAAVMKAVKDLIRRRPLAFPKSELDPGPLVKRLEIEGISHLRLLSLSDRDRRLEQLCREEGIEAILPVSQAFHSGFSVPWVGYIYDAQHRHLPHFFTSRVCALRDRAFRTMLARAPVVVVNAKAVDADLKRFYAPGRAALVPLPFSASPGVRWFDTDPMEQGARYGIAHRYFLISNQFWIHKRHDIAFRAFIDLAHMYPDVALVCTGETGDPRAPEYWPRLQRIIAKSGVADRIHILGLIPKLDQIALMRGCVAVVQPTAFEGGPGGGSVFDAVSLGIRTIVSDIPVNREIEHEVTRFFPLDDVDALRQAMEAELRNPAPEPIARKELMYRGAARRMAMGSALWHAANLAAAKMSAR